MYQHPKNTVYLVSVGSTSFFMGLESLFLKGPPIDFIAKL